MDGNLLKDAKDAIGDVSFPAHKDDLVNHAKSKGAGGRVVGMLEKLPSQTYGSVAEIVEKIGGSIL